MPINSTAVARGDSNISVNIGIGLLFLVGNMILHRFVQKMEEEEDEVSLSKI